MIIYFFFFKKIRFHLFLFKEVEIFPESRDIYMRDKTHPESGEPFRSAGRARLTGRGRGVFVEEHFGLGSRGFPSAEHDSGFFGNVRVEEFRIGRHRDLSLHRALALAVAPF